MDVQVGGTYLVGLNYHASQRDMWRQRDEVKLAGGHYVPDIEAWVVCPKLPVQANWLGKLLDRGATILIRD